MASRAVHTDIVEDLSMEGFLKAYQRFTALRGQVTHESSGRIKGPTLG